MMYGDEDIERNQQMFRSVKAYQRRANTISQVVLFRVGLQVPAEREGLAA
jgi:hypothetical protein